MAVRFIDPVRELGGDLLSVEKPARYAGGEYGLLAKRDAELRMAIAFPDLYEIGMSNQAMRVLYNRLNEIDGISCDRAFAPAPDFEALLAKRGLPLYGLDTGIALGDLDILGFTLGYELGITSVLAILAASWIPLRASTRGEGRPVVIMGGPCASNPMPYAAFIDAFWIGEAEAGFFDLSRELLNLKRGGSSRAEILAHLSEHPSVWHNGKKSARRAVYREFGSVKSKASVFPVPGMRVVQHHGAVEIMRGCPNGCRFCHAGYWYRPMRQKNAQQVREEVDAFVRHGGYREISLSSLSSGDYAHIDSLVAALHKEYGPLGVSFQLPSLRISTFSLSLLKDMAGVRKGGLTFAVETPVDLWQMSINKKVSLESVIEILRKAREEGFRGAKFYFMVGLPAGFQLEKTKGEGAPSVDAPPVGGVPEGGPAIAPDCKPEEAEIVDFVTEVFNRTRMRLSVNAGTFIPKPHTPYQWAAQLDEKEAGKKLNYIRDKLKRLGLKVSVHDPFISRLEGIISRGGIGTAELIEAAFKRGARLDAWDDHFQKDLWRELLDANFQEESLKEANQRPEFKETPDNSFQKELPWKAVESGIAESFFTKECEKSRISEITSVCIENCTHPCGVCNFAKNEKIVLNNIHDEVKYHHCDHGKLDNAGGPEAKEKPSKTPDSPPRQILFSTSKADPPSHRMLFSFSKTGPAIFLPHLSLLETFSMAFVRSGLPVLFTRGFNPLPKLDVASPLAIGIAALGEIATVDLTRPVDPGLFVEAFNKNLPEGFCINAAEMFFIPSGIKRRSVMSLFWGSVYGGRPVAMKDEKKYRLAKSESLYGLCRETVLAKPINYNEGGYADKGASYFDVYKALYNNGSTAG